MMAGTLLDEFIDGLELAERERNVEMLESSFAESNSK